MKNLTFKTQIAILFSLYSTLIILTTGVVFSSIFYRIIERDTQGFIMQKTVEVVNENIVYENDRIFFKPGLEGETISYHLRTNDLSAVILDNSLNKIIAYGVYRSINTTASANTTGKDVIQSAVSSKKPVYSHDNILENKKYDVLTFPLIQNQNVYGVIQVAKEASFVDKIIEAGLYIMAMILPLSILLSWLAAYLITTRSFKPLHSLIAHMQTINSENEPKKINVAGNPKDEIVKLSLTFNQMLTRINEGIQKQKEFIANASHELKTPLTHAVSSLDIARVHLNNKNVTDSTTEIINVQNDLFGLNNILNSLLLLSKIDSGTTQIRFEKVNLHVLIEEIIKSNETLLRSKNINTQINMDNTILVSIPRDHIKIIVNNIVTNAIKYNKENGSITISAYTIVNSVSIKISDTGIGMTEKEKRHIFDRFYRASTISSHSKGSGLGMAITKTICDFYHLKISIDSAQNNGTTILVSEIPISQPQ